MTTLEECTIVVRYQPDAADGWPWSVAHDDGKSVLTITDLDDSSIGIVLRALAQAGGAESGQTAVQLATPRSRPL